MTTIARRFAGATAVAVLGGGGLLLGAAPAQAANDYPVRTAVCTARENIQFYDDAGNASYVVVQGGGIRIDGDVDPSYDGLLGHGNGHVTRTFIWKHSDGTSRLQDCRFDSQP